MTLPLQKMEMCRRCKVEGGLMGDDDSLYECEKNRNHIWSYHTDCKKGGSLVETVFVGWIPCNMDEDEKERHTIAKLINNPKFLKKYDENLLEDLSTFLWYCGKCESHYINMMCG